MIFDDLLDEEINKQKVLKNENKILEIKKNLLDLFSFYLPEDCLEVVSKYSRVVGDTSFDVIFRKGSYRGVFSIYEYLDRDGITTSLTRDFCFYSDTEEVRQTLNSIDNLYYFMSKVLIPSLAKSILAN